MKKTLGELRVRTEFLPSGQERDLVDSIKQRTAELVNVVAKIPDLPEQLENYPHQELNRLKALANKAYEEAAMWAVKAITLEKYLGDQK